jgi:hypothetical protein
MLHQMMKLRLQDYNPTETLGYLLMVRLFDLHHRLCQIVFVFQLNLIENNQDYQVLDYALPAGRSLGIDQDLTVVDPVPNTQGIQVY